jgi:hypothetical protein
VFRTEEANSSAIGAIQQWPKQKKYDLEVLVHKVSKECRSEKSKINLFLCLNFSKDIQFKHYDGHVIDADLTRTRAKQLGLSADMLELCDGLFAPEQDPEQDPESPSSSPAISAVPPSQTASTTAQPTRGL